MPEAVSPRWSPVSSKALLAGGLAGVKVELIDFSKALLRDAFVVLNRQRVVDVL
jgi:hypothetical protein